MARENQPRITALHRRAMRNADGAYYRAAMISVGSRLLSYRNISVPILCAAQFTTYKCGEACECGVRTASGHFDAVIHDNEGVIDAWAAHQYRLLLAQRHQFDRRQSLLTAISVILT